MSDKPPSVPSTAEPSASAAKPQQMLVQTAFAGPLPPASELARYEQVLPGAAERILRMAEQERTDRQALQREQQAVASEVTRMEVRARARLAITGQMLGFIGMVLALAFGTAAMWQGHTVLAGTVVTTTLLAILSAFVAAREREKKSKYPEKR